MKRILILIVWFPVLFTIANAQQLEQFEISISRASVDLLDIQNSGIAVDHGFLTTADSFHLIGFRQDIDLLQAAGILAEARLLQPEAKPANASRNVFCEFDDIFKPTPPANFSLGSLANGYYTLDEIYDQMAEMKRIYPGLISSQLPIDTFETYEGRGIYHYVLSSNVLPSQAKPKVMMTALTHAREPMSIISQVYFYWWLLEQYDSNQQVKWLLDNTELYLVPCVNPDGYAHNTTTTSGRMGFWRKNRRLNADGTYGVDVNRNYVIDWGGTGASNVPGSDIYHGVAPLSEPEAAAVNFLHETVPFETALNVHSFSNLVITPSYERLQQAGPRDLNLSLGQAMRRDNGYVVGEGLNTVLYSASGSASDHFAFHTDAAATGNTFSFTPEIGSRSFGFFPPEDTLAGMAADALLTNFRALQSAHFTVVLDPFYSGLQDEGVIRLRARRISKTSGVATLEVVSLDPRLRFGSTSITLDFTNTDAISIALPYTVDAGSTDLLLGYELNFENMPHTLPFESGPIVYQKATVLLEEAGAELANVFSVNPALDNSSRPVLGFNDQTAAGVVFASVNYPEDVESLLIRYKVDYLAPALSEASSPIFNAFDLADPVCFHQGSYVLDDFSNYWGETNGYLDDFYVIDEFLQPGGAVGFDLAANLSGVYTYIDSLEVIALSPALGGQTSTLDPRRDVVQLSPNPAEGSVRIEAGGSSITQVVIYDAMGRSLGVRPVKAGELSLAGIPTGVYLVRVFNERGHKVGHSKLVVR